MIKVYYLKISDYADFSDNFWQPHVSEDTWNNVLRYRNWEVRRTKLLGESMIRQLLSVFGQVKESAYKFIKGPHGKPYVENPPFPFYFNISHSGDYIVCALADHEVGIDMEKKAKARMGVARRFFHPDEICCLEKLSADEQDDLFFNYWSVKESFLKYTGSGLSSPLSDFEVRFTSNNIYIYKDKQPEAVFIRRCIIDQAYKCFVCSSNPEIPEIYLFAGFGRERYK